MVRQIKRLRRVLVDVFLLSLVAVSLVYALWPEKNDHCDKGYVRRHVSTYTEQVMYGLQIYYTKNKEKGEPIEASGFIDWMVGLDGFTEEPICEEDEKHVVVGFYLSLPEELKSDQHSLIVFTTKWSDLEGESWRWIIVVENDELRIDRLREQYFLEQYGSEILEDKKPEFYVSFRKEISKRRKSSIFRELRHRVRIRLHNLSKH